MVELKPCPFCGGEPDLIDRGDFYWVYCESCDALGGKHRVANVAVDAWNQRATSLRDPYTLANALVDAYHRAVQDGSLANLRHIFADTIRATPPLASDVADWNAAIEAAIAGIKRGCNYCDCLTEVQALKKQEEGNAD